MQGTVYNGIAVIGYNRPEYFKPTLESIARNPESQQWPVFIFLDGIYGTAQKQQEEIALKHIPNATIIRRNQKLGCGRNIIDAKRHMFDKEGFDRVWVFEDDLVITDNYCTFIGKLLDWSLENYDNVGMVQGWGYGQPDEISSILYQIEPTFDNLWGYCQTRKCWDNVKNYLYEYRKFFLDCDYSKKDNKGIQKWMVEFLASGLKNPRSFSKECHQQALVDHYSDRFWKYPAPGQDGVTLFSLRAEGYVRLRPTVRRAKNIGAVGLHMRKEHFIELGFDKHEIYESCEDINPNFYYIKE